MWKKVLIGFGAILIGIIIFAFTIPATYHYEKEIDVIAQDRMVFVFLGELKRWPEWLSWVKDDEQMTREYSEQSWGVGATFKWSSGKLGDGSINVTQFTPKFSIDYEMQKDGYDSKGRFALRPGVRQGVIVTWRVDGEYPKSRFARLIAFFRLWGLPKQMEKNLVSLKKHAESHDAYDVIGDWEEEVKKLRGPAPSEPTPPGKKSKSKKT